MYLDLVIRIFQASLGLKLALCSYLQRTVYVRMRNHVSRASYPTVDCSFGVK